MTCREKFTSLTEQGNIMNNNAEHAVEKSAEELALEQAALEKQNINSF